MKRRKVATLYQKRRDLEFRIDKIMSQYSYGFIREFCTGYYVGCLDENRLDILLSLDVEDLENFILVNLDLLETHPEDLHTEHDVLCYKALAGTRACHPRKWMEHEKTTLNDYINF